MKTKTVSCVRRAINWLVIASMVFACLPAPVTASPPESASPPAGMEGVTAPSGAAATIELTVDPVTLPADGASQARLTVHVADEKDSPVTDGTEVQLKTSLGRLEPEAVRTKEGRAEAWLTAAETPGWAEITATAGEVKGRISIRLIALPGNASLVSRPLASDRVPPFEPADAAERARHPVSAGQDDRLTGEGGGVTATFDAAGLSVSRSEKDGLTLAFELLAVWVGDQPFFEAGKAPPVAFEAAENQAVRALGESVAESYWVVDHGVEQVFTLKQAPWARGDPSTDSSGQGLVIEGRFQTELQPRFLSSDEGMVFLDREGNEVLAYGGAVARDALGRQEPVSMKLDGDRLFLSLSGEWLSGTVYPVVIDPLIGDPVLVSGAPRGQVEAAVAYNPDDDEWLVVWRDMRTGIGDIYGQRVASDGTLPGGDLAVTTASGHQDDPSVSYHAVGDQYLVAWTDIRSGSQKHIYAQRVTTGGMLTGDEIAVYTDSAVNIQPAVGYQSAVEEWLVAWNSDRDDGYSARAWGQRVSTGGGLVGDDFLIAQQRTYNGPDVAANPDDGEYLAVWYAYEGGGTYRVRARRVLTDGTLLGSELTLSPTANDARYPKVTFDAEDEEYLVVWQDMRNGNWDIYGQRVSAAGALLGGNVAVTTATGDQIHPDVAWDGRSGRYLVVWRGDGIDGLLLRADGTPDGGVIALGGGYYPTVAYGSESGLFLVAYEASGDIYAVRYVVLFADFEASPLSGGVPLTVTFANQSTPLAAIEAYEWTFGDGVTSTLESPVHVYTQPGEYTVSLTVSGGGESDTLTRTDYITVTSGGPEPPVAAFTAAPRSGDAPLTVTFTNTTTGDVTDYLWVYGDGGTSTVPTVTHTHTYTATDVYTVSLTATGPGGSDTLTRTNYITVTGGGPEPPLADFTADPTSGDAPLTVTFTNTTTGEATGYEWTFGDGATSVITHPTHIYTATGVYTVSLTAAGPGGSDTLTRTNYITAAEPTGEPALTWWDDDFFYRRPLIVSVSQLLTYTPGVTIALELTLDTASLVDADKMRADGDDLRVVFWTGAAWQELVRAVRGMDAPTTTVLFPLQATITETSESYYLYYGNWVAGLPPAWETDESGVPEATVIPGSEESAAVSAVIDASATEPQDLVSADGQLTVTFPPGAIAQTIVVTHTPCQAVASQGSGSLARFDLTATTLDGQPVADFLQPVTLTLDYGNQGVHPDLEESIIFIWWDASNEEWVDIGTAVDTDGDVAAAAVNHFSDFGAIATGDVGGAPPWGPTVAAFQTDLYSGAATFAYPLAVAPGTAGLQPALNLSYNSRLLTGTWHKQAGIVGHGFSLDIGFIGREKSTGSNPRYEENVTNDDFFLVLNGVHNKLIQDPNNPALYHTEDEGYWCIERRYDGHTGTEWETNSYWLITTKDGTRYRFGYNPDAIQVSLGIEVDYQIHTYPGLYFMDTISDTNGNYMTFTYGQWDTATYSTYIADYAGNYLVDSEAYDQVVYLTEIAYTGNDNTAVTPQRKVIFDYANRLLDGRRDFGNDDPFNLTYQRKQMLNYAEVLVSDQLVRHYQFEHEYLSAPSAPAYSPRNHLMLTEVRQYGSDYVPGGGTSLPALTFTYYQAGEWPEGHLRRVGNGFGGSVEYSYQENRGIRVVSRAVASLDGPNGVYGFEYQDYTPGSDGFSNVYVTAPDGTYTSYWFYDEAPKVGRLFRTATASSYDAYHYEGELLSYVDYVYLEHNTIPGEDVWFVAPQIVTSWVGPDAPAGAEIETLYTYDDYGNVSRIEENGDVRTADDDRETHFSYAYADNANTYLVDRPTMTWVRNAASQTVAETWYYYDGQALGDPPTKGNLTRIRQRDLDDPQNDLVTTYGYDPFYGNVITVTDGLSHTVSTTYDPVYHTFPLTVTYPISGQETTTHYDARFGVVTGTVDLNGHSTTYSYDVFGRLTGIERPLSAVTYTYSHLYNGLQVEVRQEDGTPLGYRTWTTYNGLGQLVNTVQEGNIKTDYAYDGLGRLVSQTVPYTGAVAPAAVTYGYDALGRAVVVTHTDGTARTMAYTGWMTVTAVDENSHVVRYTHDAFGQVTAVGQYTGTHLAETLYATTVYTYNALGGLVGVQDALGHTAVITYDSLGRKVALDDPDMGGWAYGYDAAGNLAWQRDARGYTLTLTYDGLNRLTEKAAAEPGGQPVTVTTYTYDEGLNGRGQRTGVTYRAEWPWPGHDNSDRYQYDAQGRLATEVREVYLGYDHGTEVFTTTTTYDALDRVVTMTYPDGEVITYTYNAQGLATGLEWAIWRGDEVEGWWETGAYVNDADYNALGQPTALHLGNGLTTAYTYEPLTYRLAELVTADGVENLQDLSYTWYPNGNLWTLDDLAHDPVLEGLTYYYDPPDRLTVVAGTEYSDYHHHYEYDRTGNLVQKDDLALDYDAPGSLAHAPGRVVQDLSEYEYIYDANGNRTQVESGGQATFEFDYDEQNLLVYIDSAKDFTAWYDYDGGGGLIVRWWQVGDAPADYTVHVGLHYQKTWDNSPHDVDVVVGRYYYLNGRPVALRRLEFEDDSQPPTTETLYYLHYDHLGSVVLLTDEQGNAGEGKWYPPFGDSLYDIVPTDRGYTGQRFDDEANLYYYGARWYDPWLGQFTQPDSLVAEPLRPIAWNRYAYAYNSPTNYVDPTGRFPIDWLLDIGGLALDIHQLRQDPSVANWGWLALDVVLWALPYVPAGGGALAHADEAADAGRIAYLLGGGGPTDEAAEQVLELSRKYRNVEVVDIDSVMVRELERGLQGKGGIPSNVRIRTMAAADLGPLSHADIFVVAPNPGWIIGSLADDLSQVVGSGSRAYVVSEFDYLADALSASGCEFGRLSRIGGYPNPLWGPSPIFNIGDVKIYSNYFQPYDKVHFARLIR